MMKDSKNDERLSPSPLFLDYETIVPSALGVLPSCLPSCISHKHPILLSALLNLPLCLSVNSFFAET